MQIVFRTDASLLIGNGHVMRCLALADRLRAGGAQCRFLSREHDGHLFDLVRQRRFEITALGPARTTFEIDAQPVHATWLGTDWRTDADQTRDALRGEKADWLIVDHYALDARWETALRGSCERLMAIDDLADRDHVCDLLLDQTFGRRESDYLARVPASCRLLLGPHYALLRPEFGELREQAMRNRGADTVNEILVTMGGVDRDDVSSLVLDALREAPLAAGARIRVVLGSTAPALAKVRALAATMPHATEVLVDVADMARLIADADLGIGAAGGTSWERCALGLPAIVLAVADNQNSIARALGRAGAHWYAGRLSAGSKSALTTFVAHALQDPDARLAMSVAAAQMCDGRGASRVAQRLLLPSLRFRDATLADARMLYGWRNDPTVRRHFFDAREIDFDGHRAWMDSVLRAEDRLLLIAVDARGDFACVRFDLHGDSAEISLYLDPARIGEGLGAAVVQDAVSVVRERVAGLSKVVARVMRDNTASRAVFERAGFATESLVLSLAIEPGSAPDAAAASVRRIS